MLMTILPIIYIFLSYLSGCIATSKLFKKFDGLLKISSSIIIGTLISGSTNIILSCCLFHITDNALFKGSVLTLIIFLFFIVLNRKQIYLKISRIQIILFSICVLLSYVLFARTLQFNFTTGEIEISKLIWSDYIFHIHSIRSFSIGENLILDNPLFGNDKFRYHFMNYFYFAILEKLGFNIGLAVNIPTSLLFSSLIIFIFYSAKNLFLNNILAGSLSVILFLFNSSLTFYVFVNDHYKETFNDLLKSLWNLRDFVSYGPWDGNSIINAYWTLNVYLNQRHLIFGIAFFILLINYYILEIINISKCKNSTQNIKISPSKIITIGILIGLSTLWHIQIFFSLILVMICLSLFFKNSVLFKIVIVSILISIPQLIWIKTDSLNVLTDIHVRYGYLFTNHYHQLSLLPHGLLNNAISWIYCFCKYWLFNLGLSFITIIASFFYLDKNTKKIYLSFSALFVFANIFIITSYASNNHKMLNLWIVLMNVFTAYLLARFLNSSLLKKTIAIFGLIILTISGVVDFMPLKNDFRYKYMDYSKQPVGKWIIKNSKPNDVFLTLDNIYSPVALSGRILYKGWPSFLVASGYNVVDREKTIQQIYNAGTEIDLCHYLNRFNIDYLMLSNKKYDKYPVNRRLFNHSLKPTFQDTLSNNKQSIYSKKMICKH